MYYNGDNEVAENGITSESIYFEKIVE